MYASIRDKGQALLDQALDHIAPVDAAKDPRLLVAVNTVTATATDKGRLLSDESTENVKQKIEVTVKREDRPIRAGD